VREPGENGQERKPVLLTPYIAFEVPVLRFLEATCVLMLEEFEGNEGRSIRHELNLIRYELER
jgi:hypothetical protein